MKTRLLLLFGGRSGEYEVSLVSASAVLRHVPADKYDVTTVGITRDGKWYLYTGSYDAIQSGAWADDPSNLPCVVSADFGARELIVFDSSVRRIPVDAAVAVIHGTQGEDGTLQGLFELAGIPLVGCTAETSAICMDKAAAKSMMTGAGIRCADGIDLSRVGWSRHQAELVAEAEAKLGYPMFVKPSRAGSSVGVSKVADRDALVCAVGLAFEWDYTVLVEKCIVGREIECAILTAPDGTVTVSEPGEIDPGSEFYDYDTKYKNDTASYFIPARLTPALRDEVRATAKKAARIFGIRGLSRVDFFVTDGGEVILNEINTMPGFTPISMYPQLMAHGGLDFTSLVDALITEAIERQ